ncbi:hypothetical protein [Lentzea sp. NEAU-D7]|uniref:hypothetical protein n=1 Tax=Lentzea sp. NEAU-D7 TaxID=2994667 RepID=UPI00224B6292|nr:hypothetical protein [Lentzea sp. NEAU-D7]MCX2947765.1 hypothetical protein [Lentzea sp. NEAU-D7]
MVVPVTLEIVLVPRDEVVGSKLDGAPGWLEYAAELRGVLAAAVAASGVSFLEIDVLNVWEPLPEELAWLRNGVGVSPEQAVDLFVEMLGRGDSPSFRLRGGNVLRIEQSWDGWVFLPATREIYDALEGLPEEHLEIGWRSSQPDVMKADIPVRAVADDAFWATVRVAAQEKTTLLSERWAFGKCGSRWFLLTKDNVDQVIAEIRPRSLVSVVVNPDLRTRSLNEDFTAFSAPLEPGELAHRQLPVGVNGEDELAEVTGAGFDLFLAGAALAELYAVVPDTDGVVRMEWDDPKQFL